MFTPNEAAFGQTPSAVDAIGAGVFSGASGTLTIPAPADATQSIYIRSIEIFQYVTTATTASGTPAVVTTTNLPNNPQIPLNTGALPLGLEIQVRQDWKDLKASAPGVAVTFVFPAIAGITYRAIIPYAIGK